MSDPNVKEFTVTGVAAENFLNKGGSRRRRRSSANKTAKQEGGSSGTVVQVQANRAPSMVRGDLRAPDAPPSNSVSQAKPSNSTDLTKTVTNSAPATTTPPTPVANQTGGKDKKAVKVILAAGKKKDSKVILSPTKVRKIPGAPSERAKTRKVAKKIRVSLHGLNKRVTRANTIRKEATKQPIEAVKKTLVTAKLIKPDSKAPEDILRKMYADYMMLKNRAL